MKKILLIVVGLMFMSLNLNAKPFKIIKGFDFGLNINNNTKILYIEDEEIKSISTDNNMGLYFKLTTGFYIKGFRIIGAYGMAFYDNVNYDYIDVIASYTFKDFSIKYNYNTSSPIEETIINSQKNTMNNINISFYKEF